VFQDKIVEDTVILCDGNRNYDVLQEVCTVAHTDRVNKVNGFHSFIKERNRKARGFATIYLNRYNALFGLTYANPEAAVQEILAMMTARNHNFASISWVRENSLLAL